MLRLHLGQQQCRWKNVIACKEKAMHAWPYRQQALLSDPKDTATSPSVTGGVYKIRLHLHRSVLIYDYSQFRLHVFKFQKTIRTADNVYSFAHAHTIASVCHYHCSTCIAQFIKAIMTWRHPTNVNV